MRLSIPFVVAGALALGTATASAQDINWDKVDAAFGRKAAVSGDVIATDSRARISPSRSTAYDQAALALGGWVAFKPAHGGAMVMGDLVLLDSEIEPVTTALIHNGLEITAIHNHVLRGNPATYYLHVGGHGDPEKMATSILQALQSSGTPLTPPAAPSQPAIDSTPRSSTRLSGSRGSRTAASISSRCRAAIRSRKAA